MKEQMTIQDKIAFLTQFKPGELISNLLKAETEYQDLLKEQSKFRLENVDNLRGARSGDSETVSALKAQLAGLVPPEINGKKATEADKKAWLERQETENKDLIEAIRKQKMADVVSADFEIRIKTIEVKMTNIRAIMPLRQAMFLFLSSSVMIEVENAKEGVV